ncbi:MAG TPA: thioredoxin family protein [Gammaproteobacteria bacterium]|nr:thioredoxin family protein [Gammaproteobacteria bacterium]
MALMETPICEFGLKAPDFQLHDCFGIPFSRDKVKKSKGLLVIFMCNHCPYVKAILPKLSEEVEQIQKLEIGVIAINPNDPTEYPEDSEDHMRNVAQHYNFSFPYCFDPTQQVAQSYGAVCTPDFFGYNANCELQYRGRFEAPEGELWKAMELIAKTGLGPRQQIPSMGCSIKWKKHHSSAE